MQKEIVYILHWFGPFKSVEEVKSFEDANSEIQCCLYMFRGMKKHSKAYESFYCGKADKQKVYQRLCNCNHHINELREISEIWIGAYSNVEPTSNDINYGERIITAVLASREGQQYMLNEINMTFPKYTIYVINHWYNPKTMLSIVKAPSKSSLCATLPDMMAHRYEKQLDAHIVSGAEKLKVLYSE
ncbi:MAG: hypothetical protein MJZ75_03370 [Paludibacteraceae bacterium]|nr:hypothetical protein [Paludibacteraceae bacterium]